MSDTDHVSQTYDTLCASSDDEAEDADASEAAADSPPHGGSPDAEVIRFGNSDDEENEGGSDCSTALAEAKDASTMPAAAGERRQAANSPLPHKEQVR